MWWTSSIRTVKSLKFNHAVFSSPLYHMMTWFCKQLFNMAFLFIGFHTSAFKKRKAHHLPPIDSCFRRLTITHWTLAKLTASSCGVRHKRSERPAGHQYCLPGDRVVMTAAATSFGKHRIKSALSRRGNPDRGRCSGEMNGPGRRVNTLSPCLSASRSGTRTPTLIREQFVSSGTSDRLLPSHITDDRAFESRRV